MTAETGIIYLPNRWSGDTHSDKDTGCVDVEATEQLIAKQAAEIERLKAELGDLPEAQAMLMSDCKVKDALLRQALEEAANRIKHHIGWFDDPVVRSWQKLLAMTAMQGDSQ